MSQLHENGRWKSYAVFVVGAALMLLCAPAALSRPAHAPSVWTDIGSPCRGVRAVNVSVTTNVVAVVCEDGRVYTTFIQ